MTERNYTESQKMAIAWEEGPVVVLAGPGSGKTAVLTERIIRILEETPERRGDEDHWTIKKVKLYEVSCCTFPAYEETAIIARKRDAEDIRMRSLQAWRAERLKRLEGIKNGTESTDAQEKD